MVLAYLLSLLKQQQLALQQRFGERFPQHWLVWEPGAWTAPAAKGETVHIEGKNMSGAREGDALSFGLRLPAKANQLTIGRHASNDIVINDATVSRHHALLSTPRNPNEWCIEAAPGIKAVTRVAAADLMAGRPALLESGVKVRLGEAVLTFYDLKGLLQRLQT
jgi:hypothetical protein